MGTEKYSSYDVLNAFFDDGSFQETDAYLKSADGIAEAVTGFGTVDGVPVFAFAQNVDQCGGAMSKAQAKKITKLYNAALKTGAPVVGFYNSVGGRLEQKYDLLSAYGDILRKSSKLSGVVPQISVVLGNCLGTSALIAASADYIIMEKDAKLGVDTVGAKASADDNLKDGNVSFICDGYEACVDKAKVLLGYFPANNLEPAPAFETVPSYANPDKLPKFFADENSLLWRFFQNLQKFVCAGAVHAFGQPYYRHLVASLTRFQSKFLRQFVAFCSCDDGLLVFCLHHFHPFVYSEVWSRLQHLSPFFGIVVAHGLSFRGPSFRLNRGISEQQVGVFHLA